MPDPNASRPDLELDDEETARELIAAGVRNAKLAPHALTYPGREQAATDIRRAVVSLLAALDLIDPQDMVETPAGAR